jgi:hypothetical protein
MAQVGLHGLAGLVIGERILTRFVKNRIARRALLWGFVVGNIMPDLDYVAVVATFPVDQTLALHLHRSFSHSLLAALAVALGFELIALLLRDQYARFLGYGLAWGIVGHVLFDMLIWFSPVDVFWPLSVWGIIPPVNLWSWWQTSFMTGQLLGAGEFLAFAVYYDRLAAMGQALGTNPEDVPMVQRMATLCLIIWAVLTGLAIDFPVMTYNAVVYVALGLVFMPAVMYLTWKMQPTIEVWAVKIGGAGKQERLRNKQD